MAHHDHDHDQYLGDTKLKVIDTDQISPPKGSVPTTTLPITFFDIFQLFNELKVLFFYEYPYTTSHFLETILPCLKQSLSFTLQHFFPFAANLVIPSKPNKPHIHYVADAASVLFTVAESTVDFDQLVDDHPRDSKHMELFMPEKPPASNLEDGTRVFPIMAIQVTVMSNSGFCIAINHQHVVADGMAFMLFMKWWTSNCKRLIINKTSPGEEEWKNYPMPIFNDGAMVQDPNGVDIELSFLNFWWKVISSFATDKSKSKSESESESGSGSGSGSGSSDAMHENTRADTAKVKATFKFNQIQVDKLKHWISLKYYACNSTESQDLKEKKELEEEEEEPLRLSTFTVTCALMWICLLKSGDNTNSEDGDELHHFVFLADCRGRYEFSSIPSTYFGNFVAPIAVTLKRRMLIGENGIIEAAKVIRNKIKELEKDGVLKGAETWMQDVVEKTILGRSVVVAGSPKLGMYETDFGVGRPKKCASVGNNDSMSFTLFDCKDKNLGGIEVVVPLSRTQLDSFNKILQQSLKIL
ncbi:Anthocyanin 5-aromatic acyltransferase [Quillaja saponaria]|uniref:Anthocyanin 5-aromatic acyltransferase n=1 Tax=Quillaja saponaria TaxID=32244 RepID=A0AAD7LM17_QUISA|nr:Anthocyanin 5-aromatic acyltransferase [Quillaja saponaria]